MVTLSWIRSAAVLRPRSSQSRPINQCDTGAPQADVALAEAMTFMRQSKEIALLTLYESRINRNIRKNMEQLRELQAERKAQLEKDLTTGADARVRLIQDKAGRSSSPLVKRRNSFTSLPVATARRSTPITTGADTWSTYPG